MELIGDFDQKPQGYTGMEKPTHIKYWMELD